MKKTILNLVLGTAFLFMLVPISIKAEVKATNFEETIAEEIATFKTADGYAEPVNQLENTDLSKYKESDEKVNVYIFRGDTCGYCFNSVVYFASIVGEYGKYFNLVTYEVWNNTDNSALMTDVASVLGDTVTGVPYIVIGNTSFPGYSEEMNADIEKAIIAEYKATEKYDVMNELDTLNPGETKTGGGSLLLYIIVGALVISGLIVYVNVKTNKLKKDIEEVKVALKKINKK